MNSIPVDALYFGARSITNSPITYDKTRISGSNKTSYILHSKGGCMPGQPDIFTINSRMSPGLGANIENNQVISAFKRERYLESCPTIGVKFEKNKIDSFIFDKYVPNDDDSLDMAIQASYRQVYGNFMPMESERPKELERRLRNGDIPIREFIRSLAKSEFYKKHYFESVNQQRCIELSFKHLLGRPPLDQNEIIQNIELIHQQGFNAQIDSLVDSLEYQEVFGLYTVPFQRCWNSPCGSTTSSFINTALFTRSFATSDNAIHQRKTTPASASGKSQLLKNLTGKELDKIIIPDNAKKIYAEEKELKEKELKAIDLREKQLNEANP